MDTTLVDTFIEVIRSGSISHAASHLYISQSTVSYRLKRLEIELGVQLINRNRGNHNVVLTQYGESIINSIHNYLRFKEQIDNIKSTNTVRALNIGGIHSITINFLTPLYKELVNKFPNLHLSIYNDDTTLIYERVSKNIIDVGFVNSIQRYRNVKSRKLFSEEMCVLSRTDSPYQDGLASMELDAKHEIYSPWSPEFEHWHKMNWDTYEKSKIVIRTPSLIFNCFDSPLDWAIITISTANSFISANDSMFKKCELSDPPPMITCYELVPEQFQNHPYELGIFEKYLDKYIEELKKRDYYH